MKYFAYGSNMFFARLSVRVPSAVLINQGLLHKHKLTFNKKSHDGSAKCDALETNNDSDMIYGALYEISECDKFELDISEGLGFDYEEKTVSIYIDSNKIHVEAFTYYAIDFDAGIKPYHWYKDFVVYGAIENNLPEDYINYIKSFSSIDDLDVKRVKYNQDILSRSIIKNE